MRDFLREYEIDSLAKALYTITSWVSNRGYIGFVDQANRMLIELEANDESGPNRTIKTYEDFKQFYIKLIALYPPSMYEDFPIDKGEVKFFSNGNFYKVFIGNGDENSYESCFLIESIVRAIGSDELKMIWKEILEYEDYIISTIYKESPILNDKKHECPPSTYFDNIFKNYDKFKNQNLSTYFKDFISENDELYRFYTEHKQLPVFLPMMKECFLEKIIKDYSWEKVKFGACYSLINSLENNFYLERYKEIKLMYPLVLRNEKEEKSSIIKDSFAIFEKSSMVLFLPYDDRNNTVKLVEKLKNKVDVIGGVYSNIGERISIDVDEEKEILVQEINYDLLNPNKSVFSSFSNKDKSYIAPRDLVGIINFSSNIEEIVSFVRFVQKAKNEKLFLFSGLSSYFHLWKNMDGMINEGALHPTVFIPPYQSVHATYDYFNEMKEYPYQHPITFSIIHEWLKNKENVSDLSLIGKEKSGEINIFKSSKGNIFLHETHFIVEDIKKEIIETVFSFQEIMINGLSEYKDVILSHYPREILDIKIVSKAVFNKNLTSNTVAISSKYFKKIIVDVNERSKIVLVQPYWDVIADDNSENKTKKFENNLLISLLEGIEFENNEMMYHEIKSTDSEPRTSMISKMAVSYFIDPISLFIPPDNIAFKSVRKTMAKTIKRIDLEPKKYNENEIVDVIRQFRIEVRDDLLLQLRKFNRLETHKWLLEEYSAILFHIDMHQKRLQEFSEIEHLNIEKSHEFTEKTVKLREEAKTYKFVLEYLIEENLSLIERKQDKLITKKSINELIAFGKWILDFQTMSDANYYGSVGWNKLNIREDYVIELEETDKYLSDALKLTELRYEFGDYSERDSSIDAHFGEQIESKFQNDTGLSFRVLIDLLTFLESHHTISELSASGTGVVYHNVVKASINEVAEKFLDYDVHSLEDFYSALHFITIEADKIADKNGVIPIWEKKRRKHKFSAQPILYFENNILFSPVSIHALKKDYIQGIMNFTLPYDIEMNHTVSLLNNWKRRYEKKIVDDLALLFNSPNLVVYKDRELYKLDKKGGHPRDLGDYDLIVIDKKNYSIFLFEVKYMRLSQTMKDSMGDQKDYFLGTKAQALKFNRRIEYFKENKDKIIENLGLKGHFFIRSYFVSNKNIRSFFKEYPFKIKSYNEIKSMVRSDSL